MKTAENCFLEIYQLDHAKFISALGLAWQAALKKAEVKVKLLTDIDMLLLIETRIRSRICHSNKFIIRYVKLNNKNVKD